MAGVSDQPRVSPDSLLDAGRWLAANGATHLTLLSRSGRQEGEVGPLEDLLQPGWAASVTLAKCDVACREDAEAALGHDRSHGE